MQGFKKIVIRLLCILAFFTSFLIVVQAVIYFIVIGNANRVMEDTLEKANTMVFSGNVISLDIVDGVSEMASFIDTLRRAETDFVQFDIEYEPIQPGDVTLKVHSRSDIGSLNQYSGVKDTSSVIRMYYYSSTDLDEKVYIDSYNNCPQRYVATYVDLRMNVYVPALIKWAVSNKVEDDGDRFTVEKHRYLQYIEKTSGAIGIKFYKGK